MLNVVQALNGGRHGARYDHETEGAEDMTQEKRSHYAKGCESRGSPTYPLHHNRDILREALRRRNYGARAAYTPRSAPGEMWESRRDGNQIIKETNDRNKIRNEIKGQQGIPNS